MILSVPQLPISISFSRDSGLCHNETVYFWNQTKLKMTLLFSSETTTYTRMRSPSLAFFDILFDFKETWLRGRQRSRQTYVTFLFDTTNLSPIFVKMAISHFYSIVCMELNFCYSKNSIGDICSCDKWLHIAS